MRSIDRTSSVVGEGNGVEMTRVMILIMLTMALLTAVLYVVRHRSHEPDGTHEDDRKTALSRWRR